MYLRYFHSVPTLIPSPGLPERSRKRSVPRIGTRASSCPRAGPKLVLTCSFRARFRDHLMRVVTRGLDLDAAVLINVGLRGDGCCFAS